MTKKLEQLLDLASTSDDEPLIQPPTIPVPTHVVNLEDQLDQFDKISAALPKVSGLGDISDMEFDSLAKKAEQAYDDIMDLGMNVEARYGTKMFEVAATMLNAAITAKSAKIDKKLKMIDLQIKKLAIDKKHSEPGGETVEGQGYILTDRNSILERLKNMQQAPKE